MDACCFWETGASWDTIKDCKGVYLSKTRHFERAVFTALRSTPENENTENIWPPHGRAITPLISVSRCPFKHPQKEFWSDTRFWSSAQTSTRTVSHDSHASCESDWACQYKQGQQRQEKICPAFSSVSLWCRRQWGICSAANGSRDFGETGPQQIVFLSDVSSAAHMSSLFTPTSRWPGSDVGRVWQQSAFRRKLTGFHTFGPNLSA